MIVHLGETPEDGHYYSLHKPDAVYQMERIAATINGADSTEIKLLEGDALKSKTIRSYLKCYLSRTHSDTSSSNMNTIEDQDWLLMDDEHVELIRICDEEEFYHQKRGAELDQIDLVKKSHDKSDQTKTDKVDDAEDDEEEKEPKVRVEMLSYQEILENVMMLFYEKVPL